MEHLSLTSDTLVFFIDETGDESLSDPNRPVFGFGGCGIMATYVDKHIREPWRLVRKAVTGSEDTPLHASDITHTATQNQINTIGAFFKSERFARIGVSCSELTVIPDQTQHVEIVLNALKNRILQILGNSAGKRVVVIFESTTRLKSAIERWFGDLAIEENGSPIRVDVYFMPKNCSEPALEVADFLANVIGGHARQQWLRRNTFTLDFQACFHGQDPRLTSFIHILDAKQNREGGS